MVNWRESNLADNWLHLDKKTETFDAIRSCSDSSSVGVRKYFTLVTIGNRVLVVFDNCQRQVGDLVQNVVGSRADTPFYDLASNRYPTVFEEDFVKYLGLDIPTRLLNRRCNELRADVTL